MIPLSLANIGETNYIKKITGCNQMKRHLSEIGFVAGEKITVVSTICGNMIICIKDSKIALGKKMASQIMIEGDSLDENLKGCQSRRNNNCPKNSRRRCHKRTHNEYGSN